MELRELIAETKAKFDILKVCDLLGLEVKSEQGGRFYRGDCLFCQKARTFRITPDKGLYGCFACRDAGQKDYHGDALQLTQKVKGLRNVKEACEWLVGGSGQERQKMDGSGDNLSTGGMEPLQLDPDHMDVELLGFDPEDAKRIGIGFHTDHGTVLVPIRLADGYLIGYLGVQDCSLPEKWQWPDPKVAYLRPKKTG